jgi:hypothetical protein
VFGVLEEGGDIVTRVVPDHLMLDRLLSAFSR